MYIVHTQNTFLLQIALSFTSFSRFFSRKFKTAFVFFNLFVAVIIGEMEALREANKDSVKNKVEDENQKLDKLQLEMEELKELVRSLKNKD